MLKKLRQAWKGGKLEKIWNWFWAKKVDIGVWSFILFASVGAILTIVFYIWPGLDEPDENADRVTLTVGTIGALLVGIVGLLNLYVNYRKTRAFEGTEKRQREVINQQRESDRRRDQQQLYATNVQHLGHESESVKIGGIYGLERLAKESKDSDEPWAVRVAEILCAHIRITTTKPGYSKRNADKSADELVRISNIFPANEITTTLEVLTKSDDNPFDSTKFNLNWVHLRNVSIISANLMGSRLLYSKLNGAFLIDANLKNAVLSDADLTDANLEDTDLTGADLESAKLTGARLKGAKLTGTKLNGAKLDGICSISSIYRMDIRIGERASIKKCKFGDGEPTDLRGVSCGVLTQGLYDAIMKDKGTGETENEDRYRKRHSVKRTPTKMDKEQLVGKENVDKCIWGDIYMLRDEGIQEELV